MCETPDWHFSLMDDCRMVGERLCTLVLGYNSNISNLQSCINVNCYRLLLKKYLFKIIDHLNSCNNNV